MFTTIEYYTGIKDETATAVINITKITTLIDLGYIKNGFRDDDSAILYLGSHFDYKLTGASSNRLKHTLALKE